MDSISIHASNSIYSENAGVVGYVLDGPNDTVFVLPDGAISCGGANSIGIRANDDAGDNLINVSGTVYAQSTGILCNNSTSHIFVNGQVSSAGTAIASSGSTIYVGSTGLVFAPTAIGMVGGSLTSDGTIFGDISLQSATTITNNGSLTGDVLYLGTQLTITNTGNVTGDLVNSHFGGGSPTDSIVLDNFGMWTGSLTLSAGNDTVTNLGTIGHDVSLGAGNDTFDSSHGFAGGKIDGGDGDDRILGGSEDDTFVGGQGRDYMDGGAGRNAVDYATSTQGVHINLFNGLARGGLADGDTLVHMQDITGTVFKDVITGNDEANTLDGFLGHDILTGNGGDDTLQMFGTGRFQAYGGDGNDTISLVTISKDIFGSAFTANARIDGGAGYDTINFAQALGFSIVFNATTVIGVENITLGDGTLASYDITTANATVAAGKMLEVDAGGLTGTNAFTFNGSAETNGAFILEGGTGNDSMIAGTGADLLLGDKGADALTGGGGADTFSYGGFTDSLFAGRDHIADFVAGTDIFQLDVDVTAVDATVSGNASNANAIANLVKHVLKPHHAVEVNVTGGSLAGHVFLIIDANGTTQYQADADYCIDVTGITGVLTLADFTVG